MNLNVDNYHIREVISILENAENLLFPSEVTNAGGKDKANIRLLTERNLMAEIAFIRREV